MKVLLTLVLVGSLSATLALIPPHGSDYVGEFLCPLPGALESDAVECSTNCPADGCEAEHMRCCPTTPGCRDCIEAIATNDSSCQYETGNYTTPPLTAFLNVEECEFCTCVAGYIYCHDLEENCTHPPPPTAGGVNCSYGDRNVRPGELTRIVQDDDDEEECKVCFCGNGVLFCRDCGPEGTVTCYAGESQVPVGDSIPAEDCNTCTCTEDGTFACTERECPPVGQCSQPVDIVPCDSVVPSWFYNSTSGECERFNYGGCGGNDNRFDTKLECQAGCDENFEGTCSYGGGEVEVGGSIPAGDGCNTCICTEEGTFACTEIACRPSRCNQPVVVGECEALIPSWFYNSTSGECERFDYGGCGGNDNRFSNRRVCQGVCNDDSCPDGVPRVSCFADPCNSEDCDVDGAECVANFCGSCNAVWLVGDREVCQEVTECDIVYCLRRPCDGALCPNHRNANCTDDYCGGCNARWILDGEDVTERCYNSSSEFGSEYSAVCPAVEIDTCSEGCDTDDDCGEREICCAGCGHTCRTPRDLPYYNIPLVCPPLLLSLASDSAACDLECRSDLECPGSKICCRNGCSSSCQNGVLPAEPCNIVRERLDTNIREKKDSDDEDETSQDEELLGRYIPSCMEEGWFNPVQTWENNVWCVNVETGRPIGNAYIASSDLSFYCPNCTTADGQVNYAGQRFNSDCNECYCDENGTQSCTERECFTFCSYPVAPGTCDDRVRNYFFNSESQQCEAFVYSGCGGNENRFSSNLDCLHACNPDSVCLSERYEGEQCDVQDDSEAKDVYYYYDSDDGECKTMIVYQCGDAQNQNQFRNLMTCLNACNPSNPGPTDIYGTECLLIQCDIPICGDGSEIVYSDEHCCPYCKPDDEEECEDDEFRCRDGTCIPSSQVCDGLGDCSDRVDEREGDCDVSILACEFYCSDNLCIPEDFVCDGVLDCDNGRDEQDCEDVAAPRAPFYQPLMVCPNETHILGACDASECETDVDCEGETRCCSNNCYQRMCVEPIALLPACASIASRLGPNVSYIPDCEEESGEYRPRQCSGGAGEELCWCVNVLSGVPYTSPEDDPSLKCGRCSYNGSAYAPGQRYTAPDGCNTCVCTRSGMSVCTRRACVEEACQIGDIITLEHGQTKELDCLMCTCMYGELNCTRKECVITEFSVRVEMTFTGDFSELTAQDGAEDELAREVERTLLRRYGSSLDLEEDQIDIREVREGSVIVVVELVDKSDQTGANVTVLVFQLEQDYNAGTLVIRFNNSALVPSGEIIVDITEEEDDEEEELPKWVIPAAAGAVAATLILLVLIAVFMGFVYICCCRNKESNAKHQALTENYYDTDTAGNVEMKKVPLDEKA